MSAETALFRFVGIEVGELAHAMRLLTDAIRDIDPVTASQLDTFHDRLAMVCKKVAETTQPIDTDPRLEIHAVMPWAEIPNLSAQAHMAHAQIQIALRKLLPSEAKAIAYLVAVEKL